MSDRDDDDSTVAAQSGCCSDRLSDNLSDAADAESETDAHSNSNYSIASSDTAAPSIKLDENYDPVVEPASKKVTEPKPPPVAKVSTAKSLHPSGLICGKFPIAWKGRNIYVLMARLCLQCFDEVRWVTGRAISAL